MKKTVYTFCNHMEPPGLGNRNTLSRVLHMKYRQQNKYIHFNLFIENMT